MLNRNNIDIKSKHNGKCCAKCIYCVYASNKIKLFRYIMRNSITHAIESTKCFTPFNVKWYIFCKRNLRFDEIFMWRAECEVKANLLLSRLQWQNIFNKIQNNTHDLISSVPTAYCLVDYTQLHTEFNEKRKFFCSIERKLFTLLIKANKPSKF